MWMETLAGLLRRVIGWLIGYTWVDGKPIADRSRRAARVFWRALPRPSLPTFALVRVFYEPSFASRSDDVAFATG